MLLWHKTNELSYMLVIDCTLPFSSHNEFKLSNLPAAVSEHILYMFKCMTLSCFSTVSIWRLSTGLPSRPGLFSGGEFLHNPPQHAAGYPRDMRVCRGTVWLRRVWYDPLLPSLWLAKERLVYVQPEGLPRQTPLWAPEIRWAMESRYSCFHQHMLICSMTLQKGQLEKKLANKIFFDKRFLRLMGDKNTFFKSALT